MMREVFLDELPRFRYGDGQPNGVINWSKSKGCFIKFIYKDLKGVFKIIHYNSNNEIITVEYKGLNFDVRLDSLKKCKLGGVLGRFTKDFKLSIGQVLSDHNRNLTIINKDIIADDKGIRRKKYTYVCNKCNYESEYISESDILNGKGCPRCCHNPLIVTYGVNSIHDTAPWMIDLGVDYEEAKKYTCCSNKKIKCICPHCGEVKYKKCSHIHNYKSIGCNCGDGFSYPEKLVYCILKQLKLEVEVQYTDVWTNNRKYDFYIPILNCIIETHGKQHYKETTRGRSLQEEQENDRIKKELALNNGIEHYIELDCRESNLDWIKNSVVDSKLNNILDISNIDWIKCEEYALGNLVKEVCDYWNNKEDWETTKDLANKYGVCKNTMVKYLKQGYNIGWCDYDTELEKIKNNVKLKNKRSVSMFKQGKLLGVFDKIIDIENQSEKLFGVKLHNSKISAVCSGKRNHHKGFTFKYI